MPTSVEKMKGTSYYFLSVHENEEEETQESPFRKRRQCYTSKNYIHYKRDETFASFC
jgi:hypothetical protein